MTDKVNMLKGLKHQGDVFWSGLIAYIVRDQVKSS